MIYFAQAEDTGHIKIGFTDGDPAIRLADLQVGSSSKLVLLATIEGSQVDEKSLHRQLVKFRVRGEWFHPAPQVLRLMAESIRGGSVPPQLAKRVPNEAILLKHLIGLLSDNGYEAFSLRGPVPDEAEEIKSLARAFCDQGGSCEGLRRIWYAVWAWCESHIGRREAQVAIAQLEWRFDGVGGWWA